MAPPQPSTLNPPYRRPRPPHNRHPKPKTSSTASTASSPTPTATPIIKAASTKVLYAQMERSKGPLTVSPPSSELDVNLSSTAKSRAFFKDKHVQDKRRTVSARKGSMTSPSSYTDTLIKSEPKSQSAEKQLDVLTTRKRPVKIVDPADREPRGESQANSAPDSTSSVEKPKLVVPSVPSFYDDSPTYTSPTMPAFQGHQQYAPSTPPRFRNASNGWGPGGSPYGAAYNRSPMATHGPPVAQAGYHGRSTSGYLDKRSNPSPEPLQPTPPPIPATSSFERRLRLYKLMPNLKTLQESDYPPPAPYNAAFPHPVSAYASPGVNQHSLAASGYLKMLQDLVQNDPAKLKGSILASASEKEDLWPPALDMVLAGDDGCGIPERLFVQFDSLGAARISVGTATPAPFARIKPLSGSPPHSRSRLSEQGTLGHSQDEFVVSHFTSRRTAFSDPPTWRRDSQNFPYDPSSVDWRTIGGRDETSADFKTEVCPVWEDTGLCKYGKSCQFAHGFNELRTPSRIIPLPSPPSERAQMHDKYLPEGTFPFPSSQRKTSLPSLPFRSRLDIRRASAPPRDLSVVTEIEDQSLAWQQEDIPPIGAERYSPPREKPRGLLPNLSPSHAWQQYEFDSFASPTPRPANLHSYAYQGSHHLQDLQNSISSLSSSNHSTSHTLTSNNNSNNWSPSDRSSAQAGSYSSKGQNDHVESDATWSRSSASTTIDFSTGRSIWC